jgi:hypothetical protein
VAQVSVKVYIRSDLEFEPPGANLGTLDAGKPADATLTVTRWNDSDWQVKEVRSECPFLSGKVKELSREYRQVVYELRVHMNGKAPAGPLNERLLLLTNDEQTTQIPVTVEGQIAGKVSVNPTALFLGVFKPGQKVTKQLVIRAKQPLKITAVEADRKSFDFNLPTDQAAKPLQILPVTFIAGADQGKVEKKIVIRTSLEAAPLVVPAFAVVNE